MRAIDFFALPRAQQDRFLSALTGELPPARLSTIARPSRAPLLFFGVGVLGAGALAATLMIGFGSLDAGASMHDVAVVGLAALPAMLVLLGPTIALSIRAREAAMPWKPGIFVFPRDVVDASTTTLRAWTIDEATTIAASGSRVIVTLPKESFSFPAQSPAEATEIAHQLEEARTSGRPSISGEGWLEDPLAMPRMSSPLAPTHPRTPERPGWLLVAPYFAAVVGAVAGPAADTLRNRKSDDAMFAQAKKADAADTYEAYLKHGQAHKSEVANVLLPRVQLRAAEAEGSVEAIERFAAAHPDTKIGDEITSARERAMRAALERARKKGTLAALREFAAQHPKHGLDAELRAATRAVYDGALETFKKRAGDDPSTVAQAEKLLRWAESHGPDVEVRVRRRASKTLINADKFVPRTAMYRGAFSHPSSYFTPERLAPYEGDLGRSVSEALSKLFPAELLKFNAAPDVIDTADATQPTKPTLTLTHGEEWGGKAYLSESPRGVFVDVTFVLDAQLTIPNERTSWSLKSSFDRVFSLQMLTVGKRGSPEQDKVNLMPEQHVYGVMAKDGFAQNKKKLIGAWMRE